MNELAVLSPAQECQEKIFGVLSVMRSTWLDLGELVEEFKREKYFIPLGFSSYDSWADTVLVKFGVSRSSSLHALRLYRELTGSNIPREDLQKITQGNAGLMAQIPKDKRLEPEILSQAKELTQEKFEDVLIEKGWVHEDPKRSWGFNTVRSRAALLDDLMEYAMDELDIPTKPEALEKALQYFQDWNDYRKAKGIGLDEIWKLDEEEE